MQEVAVHLSLLCFIEFQGLQEKTQERFVALGFEAALLDLLLCQERKRGLYELKVIQQSYYCSESCFG
jgi:hypothetical protein